MKLLLLPLLFLTILSCDQQKQQELPRSQILATVGEEKITADLLKAFLKANGIKDPDEAIIKKALSSLIKEVAVANVAHKNKTPMSAAQLNAIKYMRIKSLSNNAIKQHLLDNAVTEAEIKNEYDQANKKTGGLEYHVRHMLFKDEVQAIKKLETIRSPEDYNTQEALFLQENSSMRGVGNLGWVTLGQLPKGFKVPLTQIKDNTVFQQVINSRFGAHILYLQETRKLQPPKLEDVKDGIIKTIEASKASKFSQLAKAKGRVVLKK